MRKPVPLDCDAQSPMLNSEPRKHSTLFKDTLCPSQTPWYGIRTRANQEKVVAAGLNDRGFNTFLPIYLSRRRWTDRVVTTELPLFPGYLFCQLDYRLRLPVITVPGVISIVGYGSHPAPIPDMEIAAVRTILHSRLLAEPVPFIREGQRIRVINGVLQSLEGTLILKKSAWQLIVSVQMLQRSVSVEIDPACVEAI